MKRILTGAAALLLASSALTSAAVARPNDYGHQNQGRHGGQGYDNHSDWRAGHRMAMNDWRRGQRVDWRQRHLRAPPRGYEWRQVDDRYVLAAVATGLIASIIAGSR